MWTSSRASRSGETAKTLILIGLILQGIEVVVLVGLGLFLAPVPVLGAVVLGLGVVGIVWLVLVYLYSYERTNAGNYAGARTPTLVFAILSLVTIGLISGILYIVAYAKLGDAEAERPPVGSPWGPPPPSPGTKFCPACGRPNGPSGRFCEGCGFRIA